MWVRHTDAVLCKEHWIWEVTEMKTTITLQWSRIVCCVYIAFVNVWARCARWAIPPRLTRCDLLNSWLSAFKTNCGSYSLFLIVLNFISKCYPSEYLFAICQSEQHKTRSGWWITGSINMQIRGIQKYGNGAIVSDVVEGERHIIHHFSLTTFESMQMPIWRHTKRQLRLR